MTNDNINNQPATENESSTASIVIGVLVVAVVSAMGVSLMTLFGRDSFLWNMLAMVPLAIIIGFAIGLAHWSLTQDDWSGFKQLPRKILLGIVILLVLAVVGFYMSGRKVDTGLDEYGCIIGEQLWCEVSQVCLVPWEGMCGKGVDADGFNIMKKVKGYSGLDMAPPVQDEFTWFEESGDEVVEMTVSGMVTHFSEADMAILERAIAKAGLKPDLANSGPVGNGEMRGYRMLQTLVCSMTLMESGEQGTSTTFSCGRINK